METYIQQQEPNPVPEFLAGGGEMGERIKGFDWKDTSLGPIEKWPQSLKTCIRIMLTSRQPIWIGWGKELIKLYNDPYIAIVGGKHPWALGRPASVVWKDIWKDIESMLRKVMDEDEGTYVESQLLIMERNGYPEETYYTFSYTPIPGDDGGTAGMICANTDDTDRIISERQLRTLTRLGKRLTDCQSDKEIIERSIETLRENPYDFPFAVFYSFEQDRIIFKEATETGDAIKHVPREIDLSADNEVSAVLKEALSTKRMQLFERLQDKIGIMPKGAWQVPPDKAIILPISQTGSAEPFGFLVVALNPYRLLDEKYSGFFSLIADQMVTSFYTVNILEEERKHAAALAEIDRAKTVFFSNISHEFRTPLTLLLGPIEDALTDPASTEENKARMDVAYRNGLRMQKLVNTLLEFSRIEAGKAEGIFSRVDIALLTAELAGTFRSAIERAGMNLRIDTSAIESDVYVDVDMWEKIVLNLVSNAFKYSHAGTITVTLAQLNDQLQLTVSDTGIGIAQDQIDRIFDRFHRIDNVGGRSQEGTGIGLAMVKELVKLHQGTIRVESALAKGSVFIVTIPVGSAHLPPEKISKSAHLANVSLSSLPYVQEAGKWIDAGQSDMGELPTNVPGLPRHTVLLADDNADMRTYVHRLLSDRFAVITAVDGEDAFAKMLSHKPDLLLSDVMMPKLDGFKLLESVRAHPELKNTPVIFLSARAGEDAKVEGLEATADDYLVKPFSAKELLARVDANIKINLSRRRVAELLEEEVKKRTLELNELNDLLQQSNTDLQQFAHVASHDLKEPLRKIKMFSGRLSDDRQNVLSEKSKVFLAKVHSAVDRMFTMVDGVLHYSSIHSSEQHNEWIDLNEVVENIKSDLELVITQKSATIRHNALPRIEGAAVLIYQLFYNLINNSLKFTRQNVAPEISITASPFEKDSQPFVEISVRDNGIGFRQDQAEKIFNTFARLNSKDEFEGTGLGLALCRRIVLKHGGSIRAESAPNQGATFVIEMPVTQPDAL